MGKTIKKSGVEHQNENNYYMGNSEKFIKFSKNRRGDLSIVICKEFISKAKSIELSIYDAAYDIIKHLVSSYIFYSLFLELIKK